MSSKNLSDFSLQYKDLPTLGFYTLSTSTVNYSLKRSTLWLQSLLLDLEGIRIFLEH